MSKWSRNTPLKCRAFGCNDEGIAPECIRCGAGLYSADFVQVGWRWVTALYKLVWPYRSWFRRVFIGVHCEVCGKRMYHPRRGEYWCSPECEEKWVPF
jgi:hypothetical protein